MSAFIILNESMKNRVEIVLYTMQWYAVVWYEEWKSMRLYAMIGDSNDMLWDLNAMICYILALFACC